MDMIIYQTIKNDTRKEVEEELGRELTDNELEVFNKTSRIAIGKCNKVAFYSKNIY